MTITEGNYVPPAPSSTAIADAIAAIIERVKARRRRQKDRIALEGLSDHLLRDIGVAPDSVVRRRGYIALSRYDATRHQTIRYVF